MQNARPVFKDEALNLRPADGEHARFVANYCRSHMTLTKNRGGLHTSPAMAAGLTDHVWTIEEVLGMMDPARAIT